tara:strand:+ start:1693 stop:1896 length:204 start_codon:yes stop_codon:yes gene_type:complete
LKFLIFIENFLKESITRGKIILKILIIKNLFLVISKAIFSYSIFLRSVFFSRNVDRFSANINSGPKN